jgi:hypothetical protein
VSLRNESRPASSRCDNASSVRPVGTPTVVVDGTSTHTT